MHLYAVRIKRAGGKERNETRTDCIGIYLTSFFAHTIYISVIYPLMN